MQLKIWDWKYRIGFCEETRTAVKKYLDVHQDDSGFSQDTEYYKKLYSFFVKIYSFNSIIDEMISDKTTIPYWLNFLKVNKQNGLKVYKSDYRYFTNKIDRNFTSNKVKESLLENLNYFMENGKVIDRKELAEVTFGKYYHKLAKNIINGRKLFRTVFRDNQLNFDSIEEFKKAYMDNILSDHRISDIYGESLVEDYDFDVNITSSGFGEWWDKELSDLEKDKFIFNANIVSLEHSNFEYTLYHEIYPGHGHFYNYIRKHGLMDNFDFGCIVLTEGWATYCEQHLFGEQIEKYMYNSAVHQLSLSMYATTKNFDFTLSCIHQHLSMYGYSTKMADNYTMYYSQYPMFMESYYMGGLIIEDIVDNKYNGVAKDFLDGLKSVGFNDNFVNKF